MDDDSLEAPPVKGVPMRYDANLEQKMAEMLPEQVIARPDADAIRMRVNGALEPDRKTALGQYMTPLPIAEFMASLFSEPVRPAALLDAGAGIGSLSIAAVPRLGEVASIDAWELDPLMRTHLEPFLCGIWSASHGKPRSGLPKLQAT